MISRYQTKEMTKIWDDESRFARWVQIEIAACEAFHERGEVSDDDIAAIRKGHHQNAARIREHEKETNHDVVAFVRSMSETVGEPACRHIHRGMTSSDVVDTALAMALKESFEVVIPAAEALRDALGKQALTYKTTPCAGRTHGVHAEPTTFGLRLAGWHSEMTRHIERLKSASQDVSFAKLSGAVGNYSQTDPAFEAFVMNKLDLQVEPVATQVVPRDRHANALSALALMGAGIERFATEIRSLQRTDVREAEEYFARGQTGSSAMPHKRNPITCERLTGMARLLRGYMMSAFENVALWHDRDISHSSVERVICPDAFHIAHYMLLKMTSVIENLLVYPERMLENMNNTKGLLFSQTVLGCLLKAGLERQQAYKSVQHAAMRVWGGEAEDFQSALLEEEMVKANVSPEVIAQAFSLDPYTRHIDTIFERANIKG
ncbi:MAG: adenylosuccinate lyase [Deltaproteobacteria bacterium]|jgi:adenylosuccinate lyase|nr:adenylosuccinate lyase [Deltaproteobacteria bacterium]MBT6433777.1 adenylosuccinate lyase [Deltaproteobacteria bacterium]MBT6488360.1 adenylosuccinate lyase [Deltaproteobacteria bacterium]